MLINKKKFKNEEFFDENFFLYLENDDLCLRTRQINEKLWKVIKIKDQWDKTTVLSQCPLIIYLAQPVESLFLSVW